MDGDTALISDKNVSMLRTKVRTSDTLLRKIPSVLRIRHWGKFERILKSYSDLNKVSLFYRKDKTDCTDIYLTFCFTKGEKIKCIKEIKLQGEVL